MAVNRPVKILMICTVELDVNGIARWILNYSRKISSPGMDVHIVSPNIVDNPGIRDDILKSGNQLYELPVREENTLKYLFDILKDDHTATLKIHSFFKQLEEQEK